MPLVEKMEKYAKYAGPPSFLFNDYAMFLMSPLFEPILGMKTETIYSMLPISMRKEGVVIDASITNPDMARNFDDYDIEHMQIPTLVLHAKDDKLAIYSDVEKAIGRFQNCTFISFEDGGHLMVGHEEEVQEAVETFINTKK